MSTTKSIRLDDDELKQVAQLLRHFPEMRSESALLLELVRVGLLVQAAQATLPGEPRYVGYKPDVLAELLVRRLERPIRFLLDQGQLAFLRDHSATGHGVREPEVADPDQMITIAESGQFSPDATDVLDEFGAEFI